LWFNVFLGSTGWACAYEGFISLLVIAAIFTGFPNDDANMFELFKMGVFPIKTLFMWLMVSMPLQCVSAIMHIVLAIMLIPFSCQHVSQIIRNETSIEAMKKYYIKKSVKDHEISLFKAETSTDDEFRQLV